MAAANTLEVERMKRESHEIVVVGAGPAGAAAACLLARSGAEVLLVDRAVFPRVKLCGGCLAQSGMRLLEANDLGSLPSLDRAPIIERLDLFHAARSMSLPVPPYRVIERASFDQDLVHAAVESGVEFLPETLARIQPDHTVELKLQQSENRTISARVIIVADGIKGASLRGVSGFSWHIEHRARVGIGAIMGALPDACASDAITMLHGPQGYAGVARTRSGKAIVAAAVDPEWIRSPRDAPLVVALLRDLGLDFDPEAPMQITSGEPSLTRERESIEVGGRVFLIGDATGYIEPFTGEGMTWALQDACMVSGYAHAALANRYVPGSWTEQHRRANWQRKAMCKLSTRLLRHSKLTASFISLASSTPMFTGLLARSVRTLQHGHAVESSHA